ncbi:sigma-54-dependent transcriptional regulator [Noviherbaspirillum saxi]|uniref:Sigma-54-dependent Fis family transcriptional regulator n=1 Tax=Noviherbaspirillum saxi TaxID=2320863 RepID=A0A3A3GG95_9BURK|nr:sigma-54 dependent transcriptional regulator [Noviherbaspirillum saxi]RJF99929.1 sigma-54-dependent Fis family transcriptional regulator [Noviherbaspirillum saxi]
MTVPRILVVDDEDDLRELLEITLIKMGLDVDCADCLGQARSHLAQTEYGLVLTDMRLPDGLGIELVREVAASYKNTPIAVITAFGSTDNAVSALKAGAFDYLSKPVALDQLRMMVQSALRTHKTGGNVMPAGTRADNAQSCLVGQSAVMRDLRAQIVRLARSMAPVAITGESGSGKELAARDIHAHSARADKPFIAVNCGAIPEALMEAEFFGYRKGAFTGANDDRDGFFQAANGGTLMLDEVADLPLPMQVKLLRAIQERRVRKVGATVEEPVDVRIISATHQNLAECVEQGRFRQDLFYRLNVIELRLPPLRERLDDVGLLADVILARLSGGTAPAVLTPAALDALRAYAFPGNVRELENVLERALAFANEGAIEVADLALKAAMPLAASSVRAAEPEPVVVAEPEGREVSTPPAAEPASGMNAAISEPESELPASLPDYLDAVERDVICRALAKTHFNRTQAAELLGISFRQLRYRMQRLAIHEPDA